MSVRRLLHTQDDLLRLAERLDRPPALLERDDLLTAVAAELTLAFPGQLCFKGGFVLRHSLGFDRFSGDIDATRHQPPKHKFDSEDVRTAIRSAGRKIRFSVKVPEPLTDSAFGLDFDNIEFKGLLAQAGSVDVEISYREGICHEPDNVEIGPPFYEPFTIPAMTPSEMVAEKLRALAQRIKHHDLADVGFMLLSRAGAISDTAVQEITPRKFALARGGDVAARIKANLDAMSAGYEDALNAIAADYPSYADARAAVESKLSFYPTKV